MEQKTTTIEDLLKSLQYPDKSKVNDSGISWSRIANKDPFLELGLQGSELDNFLKSWIESNPYNNLSK